MPSGEMVQSVVRAVDILEAVARSPDGLRLPELAAEVGLKPTTAHNLIRTLVSRGMLERAESPVRFRPGPLLYRLADGSGDSARGIRAEAEVRGLAEAYPAATVIFAAESHGEVVPVLRASPERPGIIQRPMGPPFGAYGSASALVFQAFWTAEERALFRLRHLFADEAGMFWKSESELDEFLEFVRRTGVVEIRRDRLPIVRIASPMFGSSGSLVGSLGASVPHGSIDRKTERRLVREIVERAKRLSESPRSGGARC